MFNKYEVKLVDKETNTSKELICFSDLNNDGLSDKIFRGINGGSKTPFLMIYDKGEHYLEQWNVTGEWIKLSPLMIGDYDENGYKEVFALSFNHDSVFLNGYEPFKKNGLSIKSRFVFPVKKYNQHQDWYVYSNRFVDINSDGYKEVIFSFLSGFTRQPRRFVAYDIKNDRIILSPLAGVVPERFYISDIDNDGQPEMFGKTYARDNYNEHKINLTDTNSYLLIYDENLEIKYPPDTNYGVSSNVFALPYNNKIATLWIGRTSYNNKYFIKIYDFDVEIKKSYEIDITEDFNSIPQLISVKEQKGDKLYLIDRNGEVFSFSEESKLTLKTDTHIPINTPIKPIDIDNDGIDEIIVFSNANNKVALFRTEFKDPVTFSVEGYSNLLPQISIRKTQSLNREISIHYGKNWYLYEYFENPGYIFRWPAYFLIIVLLFMFFQLLFWFYKRRIVQHYETERKLMELQLLTVKNQMNPHFTFNALNSISSIIYKEDKKLAYDFLTRFSDLIRNTLENAESISVTLDDELKFVENYLELEKFRFKDKFDYSLDIKGDIDMNTPIPRMIIQTFVENALKHGLMHKEKDGLLNIRLWKEKNQLFIEIEDNGIGREKAGEVSLGSTGKGLKIIEQIVLLYKKLIGKEIRYEVFDLFKDEVATGTKVIIEISL